MAERLRQSVSEDYADAPQITLSVGVAELTPDMHDSYALLGAADRALYEAKHSGRNRVADAACA